ncbi:hypothetical protein [Shewanella surugensis]|uniref:Carbohydrate kinase FGGY N-terminal domain-containing protein n=1 Tax=Shewanella surugensis TaxID=212020 RepID=A0ABT0LD85_9GAMM|nr:hypothetical protein [Shewanella surugensis]MCL1125292.1 hypothetical protein [Shewanella surugensis]
MRKMDRYFIGVDVGSHSVRSGFFNASDRKMTEAKHETLMFKPQADFNRRLSLISGARRLAICLYKHVILH